MIDTQDAPDTQSEKSEAQQKFKAGLRSVLCVSKTEMNAKLAEQQAKQNAPNTK